jgi:hypothetical protein
VKSRRTKKEIGDDIKINLMDISSAGRRWMKLAK